jgi:UTP--glucose-1-phosphate uridylyltransferase
VLAYDDSFISGGYMLTNQVLEVIRAKMHQRGLEDFGYENFVRMIRRSQQEMTAHIPLDRVSAPDTNRIYDSPTLSDDFDDLEARGVELLSKTVVIKLNGGRSTTMGGDVPKGILVAKDGLSYLEIIVRQMQALWSQWNVEVPLVLMNSFFTDAKTHEVIDKLGMPILTFLQSQVPRLIEDSLIPLETGSEEDWVPPGHGDVYPSLKRSGLLDKFLSEGRRWAFISNLDNLAASL